MAGAWKQRYRGSGSASYEDAAGRKNYQVPSLFFADLASGAQGMDPYYSLSGSIVPSDDVEDARTWALQFDLRSEGTAISNISWTFPNPPTGRGLSFNFPLRKPLRWLDLPKGAVVTAPTYGDQPYSVKLHRLTATSWRFDFSGASATWPNAVSSGHLIVETDGERPPWKRLRLDGEVSTQSPKALYRESFNLIA